MRRGLTAVRRFLVAVVGSAERVSLALMDARVGRGKCGLVDSRLSWAVIDSAQSASLLS